MSAYNVITVTDGEGSINLSPNGVDQNGVARWRNTSKPVATAEVVTAGLLHTGASTPVEKQRSTIKVIGTFPCDATVNSLPVVIPIRFALEVAASDYVNSDTIAAKLAIFTAVLADTQVHNMIASQEFVW